MLYQLALSKRIQFQHSVLKCACACESGPLLPLGSHPRPSPWLPDAAVLPPVTHDRFCLRPLLCLFLLHNVFSPGYWHGSLPHHLLNYHFVNEDFLDLPNTLSYTVQISVLPIPYIPP